MIAAGLSQLPKKLDLFKDRSIRFGTPSSIKNADAGDDADCIVPLWAEDAMLVPGGRSAACAQD